MQKLFLLQCTRNNDYIHICIYLHICILSVYVYLWTHDAMLVHKRAFFFSNEIFIIGNGVSGPRFLFLLLSGWVSRVCVNVMWVCCAYECQANVNLLKWTVMYFHSFVDCSTERLLKSAILISRKTLEKEKLNIYAKIYILIK